GTAHGACRLLCRLERQETHRAGPGWHGCLRECGCAPGALCHRWRGIRQGELSRYRRAVQTAIGGTRPQEARGAAPEDPAAHARAGDVCPAVRAGLAQRRWPTGGRIRLWADSPVLLHWSLRGHPAERVTEESTP